MHADEPAFAEALTLEMYVEGQPVSTNHMYGNTKGHARFLSAPARAWRDAVEWETHLARCEAGEPSLSVATYRTPLKVGCIFYGSRADADNLLKLTLDGLKFSRGIDDSEFAVVESGKAPTFMRNGRRFRGCWIGVWESVGCDESETSREQA